MITLLLTIWWTSYKEIPCCSKIQSPISALCLKQPYLLPFLNMVHMYLADCATWAKYRQLLKEQNSDIILMWFDSDCANTCDSWGRCDWWFRAERWPAHTCSASTLRCISKWTRKNPPGCVQSVTRRPHMSTSSSTGQCALVCLNIWMYTVCFDRSIVCYSFASVTVCRLPELLRIAP